MIERYLLKWLHPSVPPISGAEPASCDVVNLRLGIQHVNMATQYVVDINAGTHDVAPALQQDAFLNAIERLWRESTRAVEILAEADETRPQKSF